MKRYTADILSEITGLSLVGAALDVFVTGTKTRVLLYASDDQSGATVAQPVPNGTAFYVPDGRYDLRARVNGRTRIIPTVDMFDGFEQNRRLEAVENGEPGAPGSLRADLLATSGLPPSASGAGIVQYLAEGAGAVPLSMRKKAGQVIDVRDFGAIFDGRDNTAAVQSAIDFAGLAFGTRIVEFQHGDCRLSATIYVPAGVGLLGQGSLNTRFSRIGDYGDTFIFGTLYDLGGGVKVRAYNNSGYVGGFACIQDHGAGLFPPNNPSLFVNKMTYGAHLNIQEASQCQFADILCVGGAYCIQIYGGRSIQFYQVDVVGTWNPHDARMQETYSGWFIDGNLSHIPTEIEMRGCRISGTVSPPNAVVTYPGGATTTNVVENWGPVRGMDIHCSEGIRWTDGYIGACSDCGVRLQAQAGNILSAFKLEGTFVDSNQRCGLFIDRAAGGVAISITWAPSEHNCQSNGYRGISDEDYPTQTGSTLASVVGLNIRGHYRAFVGSAMWLTWCYKVDIDAQASNWNSRGFYDNNPPFETGVYLGGGCRTIRVGGILGGGANGDGGSSHDKTAVRYDQTNANPNNVRVDALIGLGTTATGSV